MSVGEFTIACVTLIAAIVALTIGVLTAVQTGQLRKREYKARLVDELRRWALDLWNSQVPMSLSVNDTIELAKLGQLGEKARVSFVKGNTALKTAPVMFEGSYVRALAEKVFKIELGDVFKSIDMEVTALGYLKNLDAGVPYTIKPVPNLVMGLREEIASKKRTPEQLLDEHSGLLQKYLGEFLVKIADIKARLL